MNFTQTRPPQRDVQQGQQRQQGMPASPFESGGGADGGMGSVGSQGPLDRLFDGNVPGPGVGELEADYDVEKPWAIFLRGVTRVATGSGVPPIAEIVWGGGLGVAKLQRDGEGGLGSGGVTDVDPDDATGGE